MDHTKEDIEKVVLSLSFDAKEEEIKEARQILNNHAIKFVKTFPMWMRLNFCSNVSAKYNDDEIDWETVRSILTAPTDNTDINTINTIDRLPNLNEVKSKEDLAILVDYVISCQIGSEMAWKRVKCKKCKEYFSMSFNEVDWYLRKGFNLPKSCKYCRTGTEKPKPKKIIPKTKIEEEQKTSSMQDALRKAGIYG